MRALLQRVTSASVEVETDVVGSIEHGWLVFLGVGTQDELGHVDAFVDKVAGLRCFEDAEGKTNLSAADVGAEFLVVSQFTLYADTSRGRRPGFSPAAKPDLAVPVVDAFVDALQKRGFRVETGRFGAHMRVSLVNDGPFTIWLDSAASS